MLTVAVFVFYLIFLLKFINFVPSILFISIYFYGNVTVMMKCTIIMALVKYKSFNQFQSNKWILLFIKYTVFYNLIRLLLSFCYHHLRYFHCHDDNIFFDSGLQ